MSQYTDMCISRRKSRDCMAGWRSGSLVSPLLDRVHASELTAISKRPKALALVLPAITAILSEVAVDAATDSNTAATVLEVPHTVGLAIQLRRATVREVVLYQRRAWSSCRCCKH